MVAVYRRLSVSSPPPLRAEELLDRWSRLPDVDPKAFREDIDRVVEATL